MAIVKPVSERKVLSASTLTGNKVVNLRKEDLGTIEDLMIDIDSGRIAYAVPFGFFNITGTGHHVFQTTDGAGTWTDISGNLPNEPAWSIQIDPSRNAK